MRIAGDMGLDGEVVFARKEAHLDVKIVLDASKRTRARLAKLAKSKTSDVSKSPKRIFKGEPV